VTEFSKLALNIEDGVATVTLGRPKKANAVNGEMWGEIAAAFAHIDETPSIRAAVLTGAGKNFCGGIDFTLIGELVAEYNGRPDGHRQDWLRKKIKHLQAGFSSIEACRKPVIAAVHGACYGAGIDIITACDIRFAATSTRFCVKEVDLAIVADVGTLQRLPHIVGQGVARELAFTGREFSAQEAHQMRLVNRVLEDHDAVLAEARATAGLIASKSPLTVRGIKQVMNYSRDHSVDDGLDYVATWNAAMLMSSDGQEAFTATLEKRSPTYED
jgi:enoyl-CoA hydratase